MSSPSQHPDFDAAVLALVGSLHDGVKFAEQELAVLVQGLGRFLRARFQTLDREEVVDLVNETIVRFIEAVRRGHVDPRIRPAGYMTQMAMNFALDRLREGAREIPCSEEADERTAEDPNFEVVVETLASETMVFDLMGAARDGNRHELNLLISTYLNAARPGCTPTLRGLAELLGISHTEVRRQLADLARLARKHGIDG
jgi:DNA-directed RNA polymerase specialized sigma24 family protein